MSDWKHEALEPWRWRNFKRKLLFYAVMWLIGAILLTAITVLIAPRAHAHDFWLNGEEVPRWVKSQCCGPRDVHHLRAGAVHIMSDGYHIDGIRTVVPISRALPSPDGTYWAFWDPIGEPDPAIFCFFAPINGV